MCHSFFVGKGILDLWIFELFLISYMWNWIRIGELCLFQWSYFDQIRYIFYDIRVFLFFFLLELITRYKRKLFVFTYAGTH